MEWLSFDWVSQPEAWVALITLVVLELVLGVDNVIFISILAGKLPEAERDRARMTGISMAVITRILLLLSLSWIISLEEPFFTLPLLNVGISGHDLILLAGGLFLLWKSVHEIHDKLEGVEGHASSKVYASFWSVIIQIMLLDIVFSLDSVITAVGMARKSRKSPLACLICPLRKRPTPKAVPMTSIMLSEKLMTSMPVTSRICACGVCMNSSSAERT